MKKITLALGALVAFASLAKAQLAVDSIEINTLKAYVYSDGAILEMQTYDDSIYKPLLYAEGIWIGGLDANNNLHQSSQTYGQSGLDFTPGPVSNDPNSFSKYDKVYRVNLQTLTAFKNGNTAGVPAEIANWPAHGDTNMGEAYYLAPFVDVNQDGKYVPADGDYPKIKGDEAIYTIFNDSNEDLTGDRMGIEVHAMLYGYKTGGIEDSILFQEYRIINRSSASYSDTYFSIFADFDLGNPIDDLVGTNVLANSILCYNADNDDEGPQGFGNRPASCGIRMLQGPPADYFDGVDNDKDGCLDGVRDANGNCVPENQTTGVREQILLSGSMYYNNSPTTQGNPNVPLDFYNYAKSLWKNGNSLIVETPSGFLNPGNGDGYVAPNIGAVTSFAYPGDTYDTSGAFPPAVPANWFESPANLSDKRSLANAGSFTLNAGEEFTTATDIVWTRTSDLFSGFAGINDKLSILGTVYKNPPERTVGLRSYLPAPEYHLFYTSYTAEWTIQNNGGQALEFKLYNTSGQLLRSFGVEANTSATVPIGSLARGIYLVTNEATRTSHKITK